MPPTLLRQLSNPNNKMASRISHERYHLTNPTNGTTPIPLLASTYITCITYNIYIYIYTILSELCGSHSCRSVYVYVCVWPHSSEFCFLLQKKMRWNVYVDTYIYIHDTYVAGHTIEQHTHIHTHTHTYTHTTLTHTVASSELCAGRHCARLGGRCHFVWACEAKTRCVCGFIYIYICTQTHRRRYSLVRPLFLAVSPQISKTKYIYEKNNKSLVSLIVFFNSLPSLKSLTVSVRIFCKNNLLSFLFHVCVYFVFKFMVQHFCMFLNHFSLPLQVIYMYFCWLVFRLIVQKQWVHSLLTRVSPHCSSNWSPEADVFLGPKDRTNVKYTTGFPKPNRLVSFSPQSLTNQLTRLLSTIVGKMKPNCSVLENLC
jgi:hypothetical protein